MGGMTNRIRRRRCAIERLHRRTDHPQSGQVLLDALLATAIIAGGFLSVARASRALLRAAEERHAAVLRSLETENELTCERQPALRK